ncbi:MAG: type II toxin-antitoxin system Phd/YefM family antitoxin [Deltaproteobacteria bacterium]|nr:type II toxin-antitoxin system Phd/YefM family antitoxin [Deltaproteobacteria bacterium]
MNATILDLRYKTKKVLEALERRETVAVHHRGKIKGRIVPAAPLATSKVKDTEFFGMHAKAKASVEAIMNDLRGGRHRDL